MWTVATYVLRQKLRGAPRSPIVLMLEPLFRCNLACAGCGKIQYPPDVLRRQLSVEECLRAADECGAPIVSIPGGEPLLHPQIDQIVAGLVARRKYVYLCTNALLLEKHLDRFTPSKYLSFSIHLDGPRDEHDQAVCRQGTYDVALRAMRAAMRRGHRVTTNTTLFSTADPARFGAFFDELMDLGVEGLMVSPGYQYEKAPDQEHFLSRDRTQSFFRGLFSRSARRWRFNQSPLFLLFLQGRWDLECTPWGNPTYNVFGWQRPCYLMQEGYAATFQNLLDSTDWSRYGRSSGNPKCANCMVHSGYEPTAVQQTFGSLRGLLTTAWVVLFGAGAPRRAAVPADHGREPPRQVVEGALAAAYRGAGAPRSLPIVTVD